MAFKSGNLGQAWEACGPFIEGYFGRLDSINADIKELEERLDAARFYEALWVEMSRDKETLGNPETGEFTFVQEFEILVWCKTGERWRFLHRRLREYGQDVGFITDEKVTWESVRVLKTTPLLETSAEVRLRVEKALVAFVEEVAKRRASSEDEVRSALVAALGEGYGIP